MAVSVKTEQIRREQQKLHRAELRLARLKTKLNKARQADARMKLRLGNLMFLVSWENLDLTEIENRIVRVKKMLETQISNSDFLEKGQTALSQKTQQNKHENENVKKMTADEWRELNHHKITIGGLLVKHKMEKINRSTLFGALLDFDHGKI